MVVSRLFPLTTALAGLLMAIAVPVPFVTAQAVRPSTKGFLDDKKGERFLKGSSKSSKSSKSYTKQQQIDEDSSCLEGEPWTSCVLRQWSAEPALTAREDVDPGLCHAVAATGNVEEDDSFELFKVSLSNEAGKTSTPVLMDPSSAEASQKQYEIASDSKVFTVLLLEALVQEGILQWDMHLGELLPLTDKYNPVDKQVWKITLYQLASHTSGLLSTVPSNLHTDTPQGKVNKFWGYTLDDMLTALSQQYLGRPLGGGEFYYCNWGFGILGWIMQNTTGVPYEDLIQQKVLGPLNITGSGFGNICDYEMEMDACEQLYLQSVVQGYDPTKCCDVTANRYTPYGVMKGQGSGRMPIMDVVTFLKANIWAARGAEDYQIGRVLRGAYAFPQLVPTDDFQHHGAVSVGWQYYSDKGQIVTWKSGDSEGTSSIMLFNAESGRYAFAASNCAGGMKEWVEMEWKPIQVAGLLLLNGPPAYDIPLDLGSSAATAVVQSSFIGSYSSPKGFVFGGTFDARHVVVKSDGNGGLLLDENTASPSNPQNPDGTTYRTWKLQPIRTPQGPLPQGYGNVPLRFRLIPEKSMLHFMKSLIPVEVSFGGALPDSIAMTVSSDGWDTFFVKDG